MITVRQAVLAALASFAMTGAHAAIQTVDFESVPGADAPSGFSQIADGYAGLHWSSDFYVIHTSYEPGSGYEYGAIGGWAGFSAWARPVSFWTDPNKNFDLKGLYIASAWRATDSVTVQGYDDGGLKFSTVVTVTNNPDDLPQLFSFNWKGIDKVSFSGYDSFDGHIVLDNIQLKTVSAVPEPETYAMMMMGLGVVGFVARRRKKTA